MFPALQRLALGRTRVRAGQALMVSALFAVGAGYVGGWANVTNPDVKPTGIYGCLHGSADRRKLFP